VYGGIATITGVARGIPALKLQQREFGGIAWSAGSAVKPRPDGSVQVAVKATAPVQYRLASGGIASGVATLRVQPTVRLRLPSAPTALDGFVKPAIPNVRVQIQRAGTGWTTVATTRTAADGSFTAPFAVTPATYRARFVGANGWAAALSPELRVIGT